MSQQDVIALIKKAAIDDTFRSALSKNVDKVIEMHNLHISEEELHVLKNVNWRTVFSTVDTKAGWVHIYS